MFYAQLILAKKGALGKVWMAAHWDKKLNRQLIFTTDVTKSAESIANPGSAMPLRVSGSLLLGIVRIFSHKVKYLNTDCDLALSKMKMAFRPNMEPAEEADDDSGGEDRGEDGGGDNGANRGNKGSKKARLGPPLTFDMLPDVDDEWLHSAALTMARKQDITMEEGEKLSRAHADGGGFGALELAGRDVEQWEAFDPIALCDDEEEVCGEEVVAAVRVAATQVGKERREAEEEEKEEEENDRVNGMEEQQDSRIGEDPEDVRPEKGDDDTASAFNGAYDGSFDAGGTGDNYGESGDEHEVNQGMIETAMEEVEDSAMEVEQGRFSHADSGVKAREPSLDLDGAVEHKGEEVEDQEVMDRASELEKTALDTEAMVMEEEVVGSLHEAGHTEPHDNGVLDDHMDSPMPGAAVDGLGFMSEERRARRSDDAPKRGKKRPLPLDRTLVIPGPIMREYLSDYSDLVVKRRRPVERAVAAAEAKLTGGPLPPVEVRMATHTFSGKISPDLEWLFQMLMKPVHEVDIPVPKRPQYVARQPTAKKPEQHESPQRRNEKSSAGVNGVEETKQNDPRYPPKAVEADAGEEEDEGYGGGGGGGAEMLGNHYDNDDDTYHHADEIDDGNNDDVGGGEAPRSGGEDNGQDDDAEFVRQNEAAQQTDATQANNCWHPNTIRMCKLLRARMALSSSSSARDVKGVSFRGLCHKRSKAAMKFFEVLQLKTWDFIEVEQADPFGDIHVLPARRFHEPIPE